MDTPQTWAERLQEAEQKIVNVAYGLATEPTADGQFRQIKRLREAVAAHHSMLQAAAGQTPTMAYEISSIRAKGLPR